MKRISPHVPSPVAEQEALLKKARDGDKAALKVLLELERPLLYDYLMRMTGQMQRSLDTLDELFAMITGPFLLKCQDMNQLRLALVKSVRKFSMDIWNAETSMLRNAAFPSSRKKNKGEEPSPELSLQELFDRAFAALPGSEREALWLRWYVTGNNREISDLMFKSAADVERLQHDSVRALKAFAPQFADYNEDNLGSLLCPHPMRRIETPEVTIELSRVMKGIKKTRSSPLQEKRRMIVVVLVILGLSFFGLKWIIPQVMQSSSPKNPPKVRGLPTIPKRSGD